MCRAAPTGWQYSCSAGENVTSISYPLHGRVWLVTGADGRLGYPVRRASPTQAPFLLCGRGARRCSPLLQIPPLPQ